MVVPVMMYIPSHLGEQRAPPPTSVDGKYVAQHLGTALTLALAEIVEKRPWDPIEYLGQWLYKYQKNLDEVAKVRMKRSWMLLNNQMQGPKSSRAFIVTKSNVTNQSISGPKPEPNTYLVKLKPKAELDASSQILTPKQRALGIYSHCQI